MKKLSQDKIFTVFNYILATFFLLITFYPLYFVVIASFSNIQAITRGDVWIVPRQFTLEGYRLMFEETQIWVGYANTIFYTVVGVCVQMFVTVSAAYALSRRTLPFRRAINLYFLISMFFGGGMIADYLWVSRLGMNNTRLLMVLLGAMSVNNMIICRNFFETSIPGELYDAAKVDGDSDLGLLLHIVLPLSKPILAVLVLYFAVGHWNSFRPALIYLRDQAKYPLQLVLRGLLLSSKLMQEGDSLEATMRLQQAESMKYAVVIAASLPVLVAYPFVQKHFVAARMSGAVKG